MTPLFRNLCFACCALLASTSPGHALAASLSNYLPELLSSHERVVAARASVTAAQNRQRVSEGSWYPQLNLSASAGKEQQVKVGGGSSDLSFDEEKLKITQLLWDFGASNSSIRKAELVTAQAKLRLHKARQDLLLSAINSYANLLRSYQVLGFARRSEDNIRKQTGLEQVRIESGSGLSTDLLQAKTQLAGAQARRVDAEGTRDAAVNQFFGLFGFEPPVEQRLQAVAIDEGAMPESLEQALDIAARSNWDVLLAELAAAESQQNVRASRASGFFPKIEASAERNWKTDVAGVDGFKQETIYKVTVDYPFNLGFTASNDLAAAQADALASDADLSRTRREVKEQIRNAWQKWQTAKQKAAFLASQADIARAFLDLAIEERQLGRRSLIDVLSGETSWINANSDAVAARTDIVLAAAELLSVTGRLRASVVRTATLALSANKSGESARNRESPSADGGRVAGSNTETGTEALLEERLQGWREAWARQDVEGYFSFYIDDFAANGLSSISWKRQRRERLLHPESITVSIGSVQVRPVSATRMETRFVQRYRAPHFEDRVHKRLVWRLDKGLWKIESEESLGPA